MFKDFFPKSFRILGEGFNRYLLKYRRFRTWCLFYFVTMPKQDIYCCKQSRSANTVEYGAKSLGLMVKKKEDLKMPRIFPFAQLFDYFFPQFVPVLVLFLLVVQNRCAPRFAFANSHRRERTPRSDIQSVPDGGFCYLNPGISPHVRLGLAWRNVARKCNKGKVTQILTELLLSFNSTGSSQRCLQAGSKCTSAFPPLSSRDSDLTINSKESTQMYHFPFICDTLFGENCLRLEGRVRVLQTWQMYFGSTSLVVTLLLWMHWKASWTQPGWNGSWTS